MIAGLSGKLAYRSDDRVIIDVGGISFQVFVPSSTLDKLGGIGSEAKLHTHLHLREDNVTLYGFATPEELGLFNTVIGVSGLGPRTALGMLSAMDVNRLALAIATGNSSVLTQVPGIGKKTADRIILELKDKINAAWITAPAAGAVQEDTEVIAALISLGYSAGEANRAVSALPTTPNLSLEEKIKLALQQLGSAS